MSAKPSLESLFPKSKKARRGAAKQERDELAALPDYDEVSEFLVPARDRDLRVGVRLDPDALRLLVRLLNHTYDGPNLSMEVKGDAPSLERLLACGFAERYLNPRHPHWAQQMSKEYRITEKGALRLLDPEALVVHEIMER